MSEVDRPHAVVWFRRDLRLYDHPALTAAAASGLPVLAVYVHAPEEEAPWAPGAASRAWLHRSLAALDAALRRLGGGLLLLRGPTAAALRLLDAHCRIAELHWNRRYEPAVIARDRELKATLKARGIEAHSHHGNLLFEPWTLSTGAGSPYRVFTPFWRAARARLCGTAPLPRPRMKLVPPPALPVALPLEALALQPKPAWDAGFFRVFEPGEAGAREALAEFAEHRLGDYAEARDRPDRAGTSRLSPHLCFGEITPRQILAQLCERMGLPKAEAYLREIAWREFAWHLLYHFPESTEAPLQPAWRAFPWSPEDPERIAAWRLGRTGIPIVDAGMRELWQTGWMHNRVRMLVASWLSKNLRQPWLSGARWFWDTLVDADLANNTLGWQWVAGCGADAAPYYRIFNPVSQGERFDPLGDYVRRYVPELAHLDAKVIHRPWAIGGVRGYPPPQADPAQSRQDALEAWQRFRGRDAREGPEEEAPERQEVAGQGRGLQGDP